VNYNPVLDVRMDAKLEQEMERIRALLSKQGKYNAQKDVYHPTPEQIEEEKLKIRQDKGEVAGDLD